MMMGDFPDYEAAAQSVKDAWLIDDKATATLISLLKDAIGAALGDGLLYRECPECKGWGRLKQSDPEPCPVCRGNEQVWPKEDNEWKGTG